MRIHARPSVECVILAVMPDASSVWRCVCNRYNLKWSSDVADQGATDSFKLCKDRQENLNIGVEDPLCGVVWRNNRPSNMLATHDPVSRAINTNDRAGAWTHTQLIRTQGQGDDNNRYSGSRHYIALPYQSFTT